MTSVDPNQLHPITCRPALVSEHGILENLQRRASLANPGDRAALLANPDAIDLPAGQIDAGLVFVAERDGVLLGFAAVLPREDGATELDGLFVEPDAWKQGIGRRLVEHCASMARRAGSPALHVTGNPHAAGFYERCGFARTGTIQTRFGAGIAFRRAL